MADTQPAPPARRHTGLIVAVAVVLAAAVSGTAVYVLTSGDDPVPAPQAVAPTSTVDPARKAECDDVTAKYTAWREQSRALVGIPNLVPAEAAANADELGERAKSLSLELGRYTDQPAKHLAGEILRFGIKAGTLGVDIELGGEVNEGAWTETLLVQESVDMAYTAFLRGTC